MDACVRVRDDAGCVTNRLSAIVSIFVGDGVHYEKNICKF